MRSQSVKLIWLAAFFCLALAANFWWPRFKYYHLTGSFFPVTTIESLQSPAAVTNWCSDGLQLMDGRVVQVPGFLRLPTNSAALSEITRRGVEITKNGDVLGLVRVHHWCGNDPVREHVAKVDIAKVLHFLKEGEPIVLPADHELSESDESSQFSEWGWNVSYFHYFQMTQGLSK